MSGRHSMFEQGYDSSNPYQSSGSSRRNRRESQDAQRMRERQRQSESRMREQQMDLDNLWGDKKYLFKKFIKLQDHYIQKVKQIRDQILQNMKNIIDYQLRGRLSSPDQYYLEQGDQQLQLISQFQQQINEKNKNIVNYSKDMDFIAKDQLKMVEKGREKRTRNRGPRQITQQQGNQRDISKKVKKKHVKTVWRITVKIIKQCFHQNVLVLKHLDGQASEQKIFFAYGLASHFDINRQLQILQQISAQIKKKFQPTSQLTLDTENDINQNGFQKELIKKLEAHYQGIQILTIGINSMREIPAQQRRIKRQEAFQSAYIQYREIGARIRGWRKKKEQDYRQQLNKCKIAYMKAYDKIL